MIVLSELKLPKSLDNIDVKCITSKKLPEFNCNENVKVIACSRSTAATVEKLNFPGLKLIQLTSAGFDNVPIDAYKAKGIAVANAGDIYSTPIAETIVYGILQMAKKYRKNPDNHIPRLMRKYKYIGEIAKKKILIMGTGNIGTATANRLLGFDVDIDGYDPYSPQKPQYSEILRTRGELVDKIGEYDYIVSTMPDNNETKNFIDSTLFRAMKSTAVFVNVGRRATINEDDLYTALKTNKIGGAVLDMFEKLPNPITNRFRRLNNTIVLPGVAAISREVNVRLREHIKNNIELVAQDMQPTNVINGVKI